MPPKLNWRQFFPLKTPRPDQERAIDWICEQFENGHRAVICELGTGVGKSAIAVTIGRWLQFKEAGQGEYLPGVTVLTSQKTLQDQYLKDFSDARDLRSASNFSCSGPIKNGSCGETSRIRKAIGVELAAQKFKCTACPYRQAKDDFIESHLGVTNYSYALSEATYAGEIPPRRLLVCDESHNIEDEVRRWATVEITETEAHKYKEDLGEAEADAIKWLREKFKPALELRLASTGRKIKRHVKSDQIEDIKDLASENDAQDKRICQINRLLDKGGQLLVSWHDDPSKNKRYVRFQPADVTELVKEGLYSRASAVLLMSATLLDKDVFAKSVGLPNAPYLSIPTPFKSSAFGVSFRPVGKMTLDNIDSTLGNYPKAILKILNENKDSKGIIHTTNYKITKFLSEKIGTQNNRILYQTSGKDRADMLQQHLASSEPTVIVSPSMMEGLDLKDDLGRFQIICKVPFPDVSDPITRIKPREWYNWRTVRTLVQSVGRSVRSENDWTKTYILDLSFLDLIERVGYMLPKYLTTDLLVEDF